MKKVRMTKTVISHQGMNAVATETIMWRVVEWPDGSPLPDGGVVVDLDIPVSEWAEEKEES